MVMGGDVLVMWRNGKSEKGRIFQLLFEELQAAIDARCSLKDRTCRHNVYHVMILFLANFELLYPRVYQVRRIGW